MRIQEPTIDKPKNDFKHVDYEKDCREALRPHLEALVNLAAKAGWDRNVAGFSLMYLAAKTAKANEHAAA